MNRRVVFKYRMPSIYTTIKTGPDPAVVLVGTQHGEPTVWIEQNVTDDPTTWVHLELVGTGDNRVDPRLRHVGSFLMADDGLVWHVYQRSVATPQCREPRCVLDEHNDGTHHDGVNSWSYTA